MNRSTVVYSAVFIAIIAVIIAALVMDANNDSDSEDTTDSGSRYDYTITYTTEDLGETVPMSSPVYQVTATDAYGDATHHVCVDGDTYHWIAYTVTWTVSSSAERKDVHPLYCITQGVETCYPLEGDPYTYTARVGVSHTVSSLSNTPTANLDLPDQVIVEPGESVTYTVIIPVHLEANLTFSYDDGDWVMVKSSAAQGI